MRIALWLLFAAAIAGNVYVNNFSGLDGGAYAAALAGVGVVLLASGAGLWRTAPNRSTR
ncbi:hypothetical protein [Streptomyces sp. CAU 1734]|uniref:hypothetical protein n=1 Tax=Streptomyces sp. CAU 1734 TaxID=3140360 RepID=UPI0032612A14